MTRPAWGVLRMIGKEEGTVMDRQREFVLMPTCEGHAVLVGELMREVVAITICVLPFGHCVHHCVHL